MESGFAIGLGTAVLVIVIAVLLWHGRFGRRTRRTGAGDPAAVWLHGVRTETPPERDTASRSQADDPTDTDPDGPGSDGPGSGDGNGAAGSGADGP